jgi:hypothetical protein
VVAYKIFLQGGYHDSLKAAYHPGAPGQQFSKQLPGDTHAVLIWGSGRLSQFW